MRTLPPKYHEKTVLNITGYDYGNYAYANYRALKAVGINCEGYKLSYHEFNYDEVFPIIEIDELENYLKENQFEFVQIFDSDERMLKFLTGKKNIIYHTGTAYREGSDEINKMFNPLIWKTCIAHGEFEGKGGINETYIDRAVGTDELLPQYTYKKPYRFLHAPSNSEVKGTLTIKRLFETSGININIDTQILKHSENINRMRRCDIYVELFSPEINGHKYGHFGMAAIEAAALGKVVVTQNLSKEVYEKHYGNCPLILAEDENDFIEKIKWLNNLPENELLALQKSHHEWAVEKHSYKAMGERLKTILEI